MHTLKVIAVSAPTAHYLLFSQDWVLHSLQSIYRLVICIFMSHFYVTKKGNSLTWKCDCRGLPLFKHKRSVKVVMGLLFLSNCLTSHQVHMIGYWNQRVENMQWWVQKSLVLVSSKITQWLVAALPQSKEVLGLNLRSAAKLETSNSWLKTFLNARIVYQWGILSQFTPNKISDWCIVL